MAGLHEPGEEKGLAAMPPRQCAGESAGKRSRLQTGTTRFRDGVTGSGSPVMGPKTLPGSESHTGKPRRRLSHHWSNRVETHTANAQDSATPVPWRWRSRG